MTSSKRIDAILLELTRDRRKLHPLADSFYRAGAALMIAGEDLADAISALDHHFTEREQLIRRRANALKKAFTAHAEKDTHQ
ncbi:hypothetical protein ES703_58508 [subsurface metagenome]